MSRNEYIIEFYPVGDSVKVSAIDAESGIEVSIVGSPKATKDDLKKLAIRKLEYVIAKNKEIS